MPRYNPSVVEPKWQRYWEEHRTFRTPDMPGEKKLYALDMFPYPSGDGLHVGHPEGYTATDIVCRVARMKGVSVLHPMGFDAFGLPAEEHAIRTNTPPRVQTEKNIENFRRQLKMLGFSYDWDRELATTDLEYFRWTQWIFLVLYDTWFDKSQQKGRPIGELPIPAEVQETGENAVRRYQDDHRLAFQSDALVNWCPALGTVLANEEVQDGKSERGDHPVQRIPLRQWMLRITAYADRLEKGLDDLNWPEGIKKLQRDWIGRSTGCEVDFYLENESGFPAWCKNRQVSGLPLRADENVLRVYTTRPDTLFGATYMVVAPEHPCVDRLTTTEQRSAVNTYIAQAASKSDLERTELTKEKTGVFTGAHAINPVNGQKVPIWIADYVLISYGTGAIMAVPAHDPRDFEFATQFSIPVLAVVEPGNESDVDRDAVMAGHSVFTGLGTAINSGQYDGLGTSEFKRQITDDLKRKGLGRAAVNYKLRDWLFSRQRFWGEPFPVLHELDEKGEPTEMKRAVLEADLPVDLPQLDDYKPHGRPEPPLAKAPEDWLFPRMNGQRFRRETNTMPQWAGSCWYYLRYIDPHNAKQFVDPQKENAWMPVDLYVGGAEHAVLHLLYARFWHKVLYDRGHVSTSEPFQKLVNQGMILGETEYTASQTEDEQWVSHELVVVNDQGVRVDRSSGQSVQAVNVSVDQLDKQGDRFVLKVNPKISVESRAHKMSKSRGNVVNPDEVVREYGADALRLYEMYMGPLEATKPWNMDGVNGVRRFLDRVWRMITAEKNDEITTLSPSVVDKEPTRDDLRMLHKTIRAVTHDVDVMAFNTAIARMIEFVNHFTKQTERPRQVVEPFVLLLAPFAPHIAEELWSVLGHQETLSYAKWPEYDKALIVEDTVEIPVQINGKLKSKICVPAGLGKDQLEALAKGDVKVSELTAGKRIIKVIVIPGRLVNFVIR